MAPLESGVDARDIALTQDAARKVAVKSSAISAFSNLSTAYNLVNINLAHVIMENQYCGGDGCAAAVTTASTACLVGAIAGQLTFGYIGDCLGRGRALRLTMMLSVFGALLSAFAVPFSSDNQASIFTVISITRLIMGVGVGGVYPLAATIAAESSDDANRGRAVSLVFSMQGVGTLLVPLVGMLFLYSLGDYQTRADQNLSLPGITWRLILGVGALPGLILLLVTKPVRESPTAQTRQTLTLRQALSQKRYWPKLFGCAGGWFLFDVTFYGNTLFAPTVLKAVFAHKGPTHTIGGDISDNLCAQLAILALIGLPGYYISVWLMDILGRKTIQLQGFFFMTVLYAGLGIFLSELKKSTPLLLTVYGLTYFFSNFGPNSTTFILPSETFPKEIRSSLNGFCAAAGKLGATLGAAVFKPISNSFGPEVAFYMCAACALLGVLLTAFFVEDRRGGMGGDSFREDEREDDCGAL